jgi:hypothetical protein
MDSGCDQPLRMFSALAFVSTSRPRFQLLFREQCLKQSALVLIVGRGQQGREALDVGVLYEFPHLTPTGSVHPDHP